MLKNTFACSADVLKLCPTSWIAETSELELGHFSLAQSD